MTFFDEAGNLNCIFSLIRTSFHVVRSVVLFQVSIVIGESMLQERSKSNKKRQGKGAAGFKVRGSVYSAMQESKNWRGLIGRRRQVLIFSGMLLVATGGRGWTAEEKALDPAKQFGEAGAGRSARIRVWTYDSHVAGLTQKREHGRGRVCRRRRWWKCEAATRTFPTPRRTWVGKG
jgi:hypothetical protein